MNTDNISRRRLLALAGGALAGYGAAAHAEIPRTGTESPEMTTLVAANNDFGQRLLAQLEGGENRFISPTSIALALEMTYNGAAGQTNAAMAKALGIDSLDLARVNQGNQQLIAALERPVPKVELAVANSLWAADRLPFQPGFLKRNQEHYRAEVANVRFADPETLGRINGWVSDKTRQRIKNLLKQGDLDGMTAMVLVNALYFKGAWTFPFDKALTKDGSFRTGAPGGKTLPMMRRTGRYAYGAGEGYQALQLPYGSERRLAMYVFLPNEGTPVADVRKRLEGAKLSRAMMELSEVHVDLTMPRFKIGYEVLLNDPLAALGMEIAFSPMADFSGMSASGGIYISKVRHKTFLEVNEEGAEAAAATAVVAQRSSAPRRIPFVVDRPFVCALRDERTGVLLFLGEVTDPQPA